MAADIQSAQGPEAIQIQPKQDRILPSLGLAGNRIAHRLTPSSSAGHIQTFVLQNVRQGGADLPQSFINNRQAAWQSAI